MTLIGTYWESLSEPNVKFGGAQLLLTLADRESVFFRGFGVIKLRSA